MRLTILCRLKYPFCYKRFSFVYVVSSLKKKKYHGALTQRVMTGVPVSSAIQMTFTEVSCNDFVVQVYMIT